MSRVWLIARREWLEQVRQPSMLASFAVLLSLVGGLFFLILGMFDLVAGTPAKMELFQRNLDAAGVKGGVSLEAFTGVVVNFYNFMSFTQVLGISAMLAGHAILHDRTHHTLPFLFLAPVRRAELLAGKVLGATGLPLAGSILINGLIGLACAALDITATYDDRLPPAPGWIVGFLFAGPAWTLCVATLCAIVSSFARDVRTAQQGVWVIVFFATITCGVAINALVPAGAIAEGILAILGIGAAGVALAGGSMLLSRELTR